MFSASNRLCARTLVAAQPQHHVQRAARIARSSTSRFLSTKSGSSGTPALRVVSTANAPAAIGPYSQAVVANGFVYCSGQIPLDPKTMEIVAGGVEDQTHQVLTNLQAVLEAAGSDLEHVVKTLVFLKDMNSFAAMNRVYEKYFSHHKPARAAVEVARLPKDVLVEIECVAVVVPDASK
ncbi:hypothetical protein GGF32_010029 [Allomyces javanicus]|nr:hypothetical protein GGF32_010029 [Allomyces javanicus]